MKLIFVITAFFGFSITSLARSLEYEVRPAQCGHDGSCYYISEHHGSDVSVSVPELNYHFENMSDLALDSLRVKETVNCVLYGGCKSDFVTYYAVRKNGDVKIPAVQYRFHSKNFYQDFLSVSFSADLELVDAKGRSLGGIDHVFSRHEIDEPTDLQIFATPFMKIRIETRQPLPTMSSVSENFRVFATSVEIKPRLQVIDRETADLVFERAYFLASSSLGGKLILRIQKSFEDESFRENPIFEPRISGEQVTEYKTPLSKVVNSPRDLELGTLRVTRVKK